MSASPLKEYVLTLEVERLNRGQVLAPTRSGAPPTAVQTVLQVPTFYCLVTGLLLLDIDALFEWKEQWGRMPLHTLVCMLTNLLRQVYCAQRARARRVRFI